MLIRRHQGVYRQYYRDKPALDTNNSIIDFPVKNNNSNSFKFKLQITGQTGSAGTKDVQIMPK